MQGLNTDERALWLTSSNVLAAYSGRVLTFPPRQVPLFFHGKSSRLPALSPHPKVEMQLSH